MADAPPTARPPLNQWGRSILLGGGVAGVLSLIPLLNLINLFFMFWIVFGAGLTVYLLSRHNEELRPSDAGLAGALSGLLAGGLFAAVSLLLVSGLDPEKIQEAAERSRILFRNLDADSLSLLQSPHLKLILAVALAVFVLLAVVAGAISGWISRLLFRRPRPHPDG